MKPSTQQRIERAVFAINNLPRDEKWDELVTIILTTLVKETDRDTRHACAEAVINPDLFSFPLSVYTFHEIGSRVHAACINAQSV